MSRPDSHDYDYPPGLVNYRNRMHDWDTKATSPTIGQDRRPSNAFIGGMPRSMQQEYGYASLPELSGTNRHNPSPSLAHLIGPTHFSTLNHNNQRPSPSPLPAHSNSPPTASFPSSDREGVFLRQPQSTSPLHPTNQPNPNAVRSTLWWGDLEPWMDEEYAKQVCGLMGWDPVNIKVPHPPPDPSTGQQANNPGYCFLTFPSPAQAASVLAQIQAGGAASKGAPIVMPNSNKPFVMNWASSMTAPSHLSTPFSAASGTQAAQAQQYPKEYSIFVGDLAPETSNSDLVAVFRNPVLGLRNDREPKFIRPFLSCKSAKIMLDPLTGVSRGYGFVRFTDEADQQRALIEMHGLYCLSRPMRISPATAKFKPPPSLPSFDLPHFTTPLPTAPESNQPVTIALPLPNATQTKSVSAPIAASSSNIIGSLSGSSIGGSQSTNSLSSGTASSLNTVDDPSNALLQQIAQQYAVSNGSKAGDKPYNFDDQMRQMSQPQGGYGISEESWKHHAQARAILGNLIGPNGEQLTSTDPYNTKVFVGGLSPLISEETLRTFFAPFGDIHYVKVPVGKHCGFVQFVRKADAEKAIEKMQGFPIGGSRIRLSWGRSQYKAAQAAAQAAQAAALQTQYPPSVTPAPGAITQEQAFHLLQKFANQNYPPSSGFEGNDPENALLNSTYTNSIAMTHERSDDSTSLSNYMARPDLQRLQSLQSTFSPFSPDPNNLYTTPDSVKRGTSPFPSRLDPLPHGKGYSSNFFSLNQDLQINTTGNAGPNKTSPTSGHPSSASRYGFAESSDPATPINRAPGRAEAPISRPSSGQMLPNREESDAIQDLNGTLASLELDRPWHTPDISGKRMPSG